MSADEDYPLLGRLAADGSTEATRALQEIDLLRDDCATFLARLAFLDRRADD